MKLLAHSLALAALLGIASTAHADLFNFSYTLPTNTGSGVAAMGQFTTDPFNGTYYLITGITGTRTYDGVTANITGLLPINSFGGNDNKLFPADPYFNILGVSYTLDQTNPGGGGNRVNFYYSSSLGYTENGAPGFRQGAITVTPAAAAVPEPGTIALLVGMGISGIALKRRRK